MKTKFNERKDLIVVLSNLDLFNTSKLTISTTRQIYTNSMLNTIINKPVFGYNRQHFSITRTYKSPIQPKSHTIDRKNAMVEVYYHNNNELLEDFDRILSNILKYRR